MIWSLRPGQPIPSLQQTRSPPSQIKFDGKLYRLLHRNHLAQQPKSNQQISWLTFPISLEPKTGKQLVRRFLPLIACHQTHLLLLN